jgi:hypothetical protein
MNENRTMKFVVIVLRRGGARRGEFNWGASYARMEIS